MEHNIKIIIAAHKAYRMPQDQLYLPVHVGAANAGDLDLGYTKDNTGDNISHLNPSYCELTGLYWAWKNLDCDYIGLAHYRRHFAMKRKSEFTGKDEFDNILTYEELKPYLGKIKVFVPSRRKYYIETLYSHYAHTHYASHLDETRKIIEEKYPEYTASFDKVIKHTYGYMFNMMIMQKDLLDDYCSWLFDILFELDKRIDKTELSAFQGRYLGRISEIIFNVWLDQKMTSGALSKSEAMELQYLHTEKENKLKKGIAFLKAKFIGKKYEGSF